jgi:glycine cleavage system aminomethyltransferase T
VHAHRVDFVGELGFEPHYPIEMQKTIADSLMDQGKAMDSLRLKKSPAS